MEPFALFAGGRKRAREAERVGGGERGGPATTGPTTLGGAPPIAATSFAQLGCLSPALVRAAHAMGLRRPTPVQAACVPALLSDVPAGESDPEPAAEPAPPRGPDCIACAPTGTGKTAAFALPILQRLSRDPFGIQSLVITPARELAFQIAEQLSALGAPLGAHVVAVTGGTDQVVQAAQLQRRPHVVVATPGRLAHHLAAGSASRPDLTRLSVLVVDECDRLLDESFARDLAVILAAALPSAAQRQTLLFSATVTAEVRSQETMLLFGVRPHCLFEYGLPRLEVESSGTATVTVAPRPKKRKGTTAAEAATVPVMSSSSLSSSTSSSSSLSTSSAVIDALLTPVLSPELRQEYLFVPAAVKNAYLWQLLLALGPQDLTVGGAPGVVAKKGKRARLAAATSGTEAFGTSAAARAEAEAALVRARSVVVFAASCRSAQLVCELCIELGMPAAALHSALPQAQRLGAVAKFKGGRVRVLVATDVASRGLDLPAVDLVINYDVPRVPSDYVHRCGRTARAGRSGRCVTIVTQYEVALLQTIERAVLRGRALPALSVAVCPEAQVLQKLTRTATALHLAKARLVDTGVEAVLSARKQRQQRQL